MNISILTKNVLGYIFNKMWGKLKTVFDIFSEPKPLFQSEASFVTYVYELSASRTNGVFLFTKYVIKAKKI